MKKARAIKKVSKAKKGKKEVFLIFDKGYRVLGVFSTLSLAQKELKEVIGKAIVLHSSDKNLVITNSYKYLDENDKVAEDEYVSSYNIEAYELDI